MFEKLSVSVTMHKQDKYIVMEKTNKVQLNIRLVK